jgi:hypothetical protein
LGTFPAPHAGNGSRDWTTVHAAAGRLCLVLMRDRWKEMVDVTGHMMFMQVTNHRKQLAKEKEF